MKQATLKEDDGSLGFKEDSMGRNGAVRTRFIGEGSQQGKLLAWRVGTGD